MAHSLRQLARMEEVDLGEEFYSTLESVEDFENYMGDPREYDYDISDYDGYDDEERAELDEAYYGR